MALVNGMSERQIADMYREDDVPISNIRQSATRIIFYTCFAVFVALIIAAIFLNIPREVEVPFVVKSDKHEVNYRFSENTRVEKVFIKPGQHVNAGDSLARITSASIVSLLNQYASAIESRKLFESSEVPMNKNEKESLALQRSKYQSQINDASKERQLKLKKQNSEIENLQQELNAASKHLSETKKLQSQGFASEKELRDAQLKESNAKDILNRARQQNSIELGNLDQRIKQSQIDQSMIGVNSSRSDLELSSKRAQLDAAVTALQTKMKDTYGNVSIIDGSLILRASADLTVSFAFDDDRELAAGDILMKLISAPSKVYAATSVAPQHIGSIRSGMSVSMKLSSFPYYHWGTVRGVVQHLSITPDDKGSYPIEIEITDAGQLSDLLQIGMNGEADILVDSRPLGSYIFDQVMGRLH